jgi:endonuclease III
MTRARTAVPTRAGGSAPKSKIQSGLRPAGTKPSRPVASVRASDKRAVLRRKIPTDRLPAHSAEIYRRLQALYPDAHCELDYANAWQLLIATILSAQTTDKRVNIVTPQLFAKYPTPPALAAARQQDVEEIIKSTGFFRNKARSIIGMANAVVETHGGRIPGNMSELVTLPGVGRKTANVVLGNAFDTNDGVVVDTHVQRLAARLGLTKETTPIAIEQDLMRLFPREQWTLLSHLLIWHGRRVCEAKRPRCGECVLNDICPSSLV